MRKRKLYDYFVTICAALMIGTPLSLVWNYLPQLFPFVVTWLIIHPIYKIWRELGDL